MYELEVTLKQHTPIIHFQHEQEGATLRATEVKPKLDRFIIEQLGGIKEVRNAHKDWFVSENSNALNYKIKIHGHSEVSRYYFTSNPASAKNDDSRNILTKKEFNAKYINRTQYFANNENVKSDFIKNKEDVKIGILSSLINFNIIVFDTLLHEKLSTYINAFFLTNTFGSRQSKGFGVFCPIDIKEIDIIDAVKNDKNILGLFKLGGNQISSFYESLQKIAVDYSLLKRGKSHGGYQKSKLWEYFCETQNIRWEKRKIKRHIKANNELLFNSLKHGTTINRIDDCKNDGTDYAYVRALLGLAEQFEFVKTDKTRLKVKISDSLMDENKIERFQSPLRYIVIGGSIYLLVFNIPQELSSYKDRDGNKIPRSIVFSINGLTDFNLQIPENFDILDFIEKKSGYIKLV